MSYFESTQISNPLTLLGNVKTAQTYNIIDLKSSFGLSNLRNTTSTAGSGAIAASVGDPEYDLTTGTTTASSVTLSSGERGRYVAGTEGQAGVGVRIPSQTWTGTSYAEWGYYDDNDGFGFGIDATDTYVFTLKGGSKTKVYQSNWNGDKLDGTGDSGITLSLADGNIFQINYLYYGYGNIQYSIVVNDGNLQKVIVAHNTNPSESISTLDPNLPIRVDISNGGTTTDYQILVAGRQYSIYAEYDPRVRINSQYRLSQGSVGTTILPLITFRKKTSYLSVPVQVQGYNLITSADLLYQIRLDGSLTGASYATPTDTTSTETACEIDVTASAISGGELLYQGIVSANGSGSLAEGFAEGTALGLDIIENKPVTLCARAISGTTTISSVIRWREEW